MRHGKWAGSFFGCGIVVSAAAAFAISAENQYVVVTCDTQGVEAIVPVDDDFYITTRGVSSPPFLADIGVVAKTPWKLLMPADGKMELEIGEYGVYKVEDETGLEDDVEGRIYLPRVDIDVDSNYDGVIDEDNDDKIEESSGGITATNVFREIKLAVYPPNNVLKVGKAKLDVRSGVDNIKIWTDQNRTTEITSGTTWDIANMPDVLYVEGIKGSDAPRDVSIALEYSHGSVTCDDLVNMTVVEPDIDVDSNYDGVIDEDNDDKIEESAGGITATNVFREIKLAMHPPKSGLKVGTATLVVRSGEDKIKIWTDQNRTTEIKSGDDWDVASMPETLYVEGIKGSDSMGDISIALEYNYGSVTCDDLVTMTVTVIKVKAIQYKLNGVWTNTPASFSDIGKDTSITFRALTSPDGANWPAGFPKWGGETSGSGDEKQIMFSASGKRTINVTCGNTISVPVNVDVENKTITISWDVPGYSSDSSSGDSTCIERNYTATYVASANVDANEWLLKVSEIHGGADITVHTGGSRDPFVNPPSTEAEAVDAVTVMKGYYNRGARAAWHTEAASRSHEEYHYLEWSSIGDHYWPQTEAAIESIKTTYHDHPTEALAVAAMRSGANGADAKLSGHTAVCRNYWFTLGDSSGDRPYAAGQLTLNAAIVSVQNLAAKNSWNVPQGIDTPSTANPCYQPWAAYNP